MSMKMVEQHLSSVAGLFTTMQSNIVPDNMGCVLHGGGGRPFHLWFALPDSLDCKGVAEYQRLIG